MRELFPEESRGECPELNVLNKKQIQVLVYRDIYYAKYYGGGVDNGRGERK